MSSILGSRRRTRTKPKQLRLPEQLESRLLLALAAPGVLPGRDTNDFYMRPTSRPGDDPNPQWNMEMINANATWGVYSGQQRNVVAVMDYGIDFEHEDFGASRTVQGNLWDNGKIHSSLASRYKFSKRGWDEYTPSNADNATKPLPGEFLGNHAAGIIGAATNNNKGVAGINWSVQLYSAKAVQNDNTSLSIIRRAVEHIKYLRAGPDNPDQHLVRVAAWGHHDDEDFGNPFPIPYFADLGRGIPDPTKGMIVTVPSGDWDRTWPTKYYVRGTWDRTPNPPDRAPFPPAGDLNPPGVDSYSPGGPDNILSVGATDINNNIWPGTANRDKIDIYAPGVDIWSTWGLTGSDAYKQETGTRQAAAHVAGAVAIIYDAATQHGKTLEYHDVRRAIIQGGRDVGLDRPLLDIYGALKYLGLHTRPNPLAAELRIEGGQAKEGDGGTSLATFTLSLSKPLIAPTTIICRIEDGTARADDADYLRPRGTGLVAVTIPAGQTTGSFSVVIRGDRKIEADEFFTARIVQAPFGLDYSAQPAATWTIQNDDLIPTVTISDVRSLEGSASRPGAARVLVSLSGATGSPVTVQYSLVNGTALAGRDYVVPAGPRSVTIAAGQRTAAIVIPFIGNATVQLDRSFRVELSSPVDAELGAKATADVTIVDDDQVVFMTRPAAVRALAGSEVTLRFSVSLPSYQEQEVRVDYTTRNGAGIRAAAAEQDFATTQGTVVFEPGETQKFIDVTVLRRRSNERYPKDFMLVLTNPVGASLGPLLSEKLIIGRIG